MRSKLQYLYSISVFLGVLVTSYMMMSKEESARQPFQALQPSSQRVESAVSDTALQSLIDVEQALQSVKKTKTSGKSRLPSQDLIAE